MAKCARQSKLVIVTEITTIVHPWTVHIASLPLNPIIRTQIVEGNTPCGGGGGGGNAL